jgi:hypothetical protein
MRVDEFDRDQLENAYYDPALDKSKQRNLGQTRKPRLFLFHLNRLKRLRAFKKLDALKHQDLLGIMYAAPEEGDAMMGGGGLGGGLGGDLGGPPPGL